MPTWSDKLLQEVIRKMEAYYEPRFSIHPHDYRPEIGRHIALIEIRKKGRGKIK